MQGSESKRCTLTLTFMGLLESRGHHGLRIHFIPPSHINILLYSRVFEFMVAHQNNESSNGRVMVKLVHLLAGKYAATLGFYPSQSHNWTKLQLSVSCP